MTKRHSGNERIKRHYLQFLKDAKGRDEASVDAVAQALDEFDSYSSFRDFKKFHIQQARGYKEKLLAATNAQTGRPLAAATIHSRLAALKAFFEWLSREPGYRRTVKFADAAYFNPTDNMTRVATAHRYKECATIRQIETTLSGMPSATDIELRNRAVLAATILTGARDRALISFKLKHIHAAARMIDQDAREVHTKRAKTFTSWFFPVGDSIEKIVVDWVAYLRDNKQFGPDDPLFPKTLMVSNAEVGFHVAGLDRAHWSSAAPVRAIFKAAFESTGLPYRKPHSFRDTLVQLAYDLKLSAEEFKAWSQNLGHDSLLTTFSSYGTISPARQGELLRGLAASTGARSALPDFDAMRRLFDQIERDQRLPEKLSRKELV